MLTVELPVETADITRVFESFLIRFTRAYPAITVRRRKTSGMTLRYALSRGKADVGIVFDQTMVTCDPDLSEFLACLPLPGAVEQERYVWIHESHPLARLADVRIADLDGCKMLVPADLRYRIYEQFVCRMAEENGIRFHIVHGPGSHYESVLSITPDEIEILSSRDIDEPMYASVEGRVFKRSMLRARGSSHALCTRAATPTPLWRRFATSR